MASSLNELICVRAPEQCLHLLAERRLAGQYLNKEDRGQKECGMNSGSRRRGDYEERLADEVGLGREKQKEIIHLTKIKIPTRLLSCRRHRAGCSGWQRKGALQGG